MCFIWKKTDKDVNNLKNYDNHTIFNLQQNKSRLHYIIIKKEFARFSRQRRLCSPLAPKTITKPILTMCTHYHFYIKRVHYVKLTWFKKKQFHVWMHVILIFKKYQFHVWMHVMSFLTSKDMTLKGFPWNGEK